jgi:hypothetical protein
VIVDQGRAGGSNVAAGLLARFAAGAIVGAAPPPACGAVPAARLLLDAR